MKPKVKAADQQALYSRFVKSSGPATEDLGEPLVIVLSYCMKCRVPHNTERIPRRPQQAETTNTEQEEQKFTAKVTPSSRDSVFMSCVSLLSLPVGMHHLCHLPPRSECQRKRPEGGLQTVWQHSDTHSQQQVSIIH